MKNKPAHLSRRSFIRNTAIAAGTISIVPASVIGCKGTMPNDRINLGFIGTGKLVRNLHKQFIGIDGVQIVAGCDVDSQKLEYFKNAVEQYYAEQEGVNYKGCKTFRKYEDLIADESIDAVVVATPDHWHAIPSVAAMKAGKDVYCEKPLSHTVEEGQLMVKTARAEERVVQTGSMQRSWENFRHAVELVINGYIGDISRVIVNVGDPARKCDLPGEPTPDYLDWERWVGPARMREYSSVLSPPITDQGWPRWRDYMEFGGGIICDWGAHMFDIAQWALEMDDSGPVQFIPPADPQAKRGMKFMYQNGVEMVHEDFGRGWAVRFIGSEGSLDISREFKDSKPEHLAEIEIKDSDKRVYKSDNHYADWIEAIRNRTHPVADVAIGHRTATICNIANIGYQLRRTLDWDPVAEMFLNDEEANNMLGKTYREPYTL